MSDRIQQLLKEAKALNDDSRRETAQKVLDYYNGLFDEKQGTSGYGYFESLMRERYKKTHSLIYPFATYVNIMAPITEKRSMVFKEEVQFEIADDDDAGTKTTWLYDNILPDDAAQVLKTSDSYKTLLKTIHIRVNWRYGKLCWDLITPNVTVVEQDDLDPTIATAVIVEQFYKDDQNKTTRIFKVWTNDEYWSEDEHGNPIDERVPNPYGELPFIVVRDALALDRYFLEHDTSLINAQEAANFMKTAIQYLAAYCQPTTIVKNWNSKDGAPMVGPASILQFDSMDPQADIGIEYTDPPLNIDTLRNELDTHIRETFMSYGCQPPRATGQVSSGIALKLEQYDMIERREDQVGVWRTALRELLRMSILVWEKETNSTAPITADDITIDIGEVQFPQDRKEVLDNYDAEIKLGIKSPIDVLIEENPELDRDEAERKYRDNMQLRKDMTKRFALSDLVNEQEAQQQP